MRHNFMMHDFSHFDPDLVAHHEADLWKVYYERKPLQLFQSMLQLLQTQFGLSLPQALYAGYLMTRAQFIFARDRDHYRQARYYLYRFFRVINPKVPLEDTYRITLAEFDWWLVHRALFDVEDKVPLIKSFQRLYQIMYGLSEEQSYDAARLRTEATVVSDQWLRDHDTERHYPQIVNLLEQSYRALRAAIDARIPVSRKVSRA